MQKGFSLVEALLAVTIFGLLSSAIIGAIVYGRTSTASSGDHTRAAYIAEEGIEAVRNVKNASYGNLGDGTYGLIQSGNAWGATGTSDTTGIYTRSVTISSGTANHKLVTSHVSWNGTAGSGQVDISTQFTNWMAALTKSWSNPSQYSSLDLAGTIAGYKVATAGSYAYIVRNSATGPNFFVINISNPNSPTVVGSMTLTGTPTNVAISGNYAYVSNSLSTAELQIVNVTTPATPTLAGTYNAIGTAGGLGVSVVGTTAYLTRSANGGSDEFVVVNAATPSSPVRTMGYSLNVNMYESYINGTTAYVATGSDTQELLVINMVVPTLLTLGTSVNLPGTTDATTITGLGNTLVIGQGTTLYTSNVALALIPAISGSVVLPGTINDVAADLTRGYAFVGTNAAAGEFQVVNTSNLTAPVILSTVNMAGSLNLTGVAYNSTYDVVPGASSNTAAESVVFGPN